VTLALTEHPLRVETARFGPMTFQVGVDSQALEVPLLRVSDAHERFRESPLSQVASRLQREVVVSSIFGTNSIEGGTLSEQETQLALELGPARVQGAEQQRALNLNAAYEISREAASDPKWRLDIAFIRRVHAAITNELPHERNQPGLLRDNPKSVVTWVGDAGHGGRYKPPQYGGDVQSLLEALITWHEALRTRGVPVLIRAPLVHYYYALVHPFWDGNGRVGRVLEATLLQAEGFRYAPFAQARYYFEHIDHYFTLFNTCRSRAAKGQGHPNTPFVVFFLEGMLASINALHDRVNTLVRLILFENELKRRHDEKEINARQYAIVSQVLAAGTPVPVAELRRSPWYQALYVDRTDKTRQRDLRRLREAGLILQDEDNRLWPGCVSPATAQDKKG
jgi:Fic family protein